MIFVKLDDVLLPQVFCNFDKDCEITYEHVITEKSESISFKEPDVEEEKGYLILTGRFPPLLPDTCESAAIDYFGPEGNGECPGITQLQEDQRPIMDLNWPRQKLSTFSLTEFKKGVAKTSSCKNQYSGYFK